MASPPIELHQADLRGGRRTADRSFKLVTVLAGVFVLVILALITFTLADKSALILRETGLSFFTESRWAPAQGVYGAAAFIYGTALTALIAVILAVPVSVGIALFITQVAPSWLKRPLVSLIDLVAVMPSVVFGLWGILYFAPKLHGFFTNLNAWFGDVPVIGRIFGPVLSGRAFVTAGIILAVMIIPIVSSIAREVIETTPETDRDGALALGATRWEMITGAVIPHSAGGITGGVMLGLGRAMGETIAAALVIGSSPVITANIFSPGDSLPAVIAFQWGEATSDEKRSALIAMGLTLFVLTIIVNLLATWIVNRSLRRMRGTA